MSNSAFHGYILSSVRCKGKISFLGDQSIGDGGTSDRAGLAGDGLVQCSGADGGIMSEAPDAALAAALQAVEERIDRLGDDQDPLEALVARVVARLKLDDNRQWGRCGAGIARRATGEETLRLGGNPSRRIPQSAYPLRSSDLVW